MQLSLPANKSTELTFKVGIGGTQTQPTTVSVVLERDGKTLTFNADKAPTGDDWVAVIEKPGSTFESGDVKMSISVLLNNRLFTPMKSSATIITEPEVVIEPTIEQEIEVAPAVEQVVPEPVTEIIPPAQTEVEKKKKVKTLLAKAQADVDAKKKNESPQIKMNLLKTVEPAMEAAPVVESVPENPAPKPSKPIFTIKKTGTRII
jgi:hypothetical protein